MVSDLRQIVILILSLAGLCSSQQLGAIEVDGLDLPDTQPASAAEAIEATTAIVARARDASHALTSANCATLADAYALVVASTDKLSPTISQLHTLRERGADLAVLCRQVIQAIERRYRDDESALETFYRSRAWYLMNGAIATLRYWQAWIDLSLATMAPNQEERLRMLSAAQRAFQFTSLHVHYPGIVYGSWLGLAKVEIERDEYQKAEQRIRLLEQALSGSTLTDLKMAVDRELRVLKLQQGAETVISPATGQLSEEAANALWDEALILLEKQREEGTGAILAAQRLRAVLQSGFIDDQRLTELMAYREQVVGTDVGLLSHLVELEYAFDYQKYNTVVLKYRDFIASSGATYSLNLSRYQYHYAVSLYHIDLYEDALAVVLELRESAVRAAKLEPALSTLQFAVAGKLFQYRADAESKRAYVESARNVVGRTQGSEENDMTVARAWAVLARFEEDREIALQYFSTAEKYAGSSQDLVTLARYLKLGEQFENAYRENDTEELRTLAERGARVYRELKKSQRNEPAVAALAVQFDALGKEDPVVISRRIDKISQLYPNDESLQRRLFRARLLLAGRIPAGLPGYVGNLASNDTNYWMQDELYRLVVARDRSGDLSGLGQLAEWLIPQFSGRPEVFRYLHLVMIRSFMHAGESELAFQLATDMVNEFPQSGDAWKIYAEAAQQSGNLFEADRAWARIAHASVEGSPLWLDSAINRLELQSYESRDIACRLLTNSAPYISSMDAAQFVTLEKWNRQLQCQINEYEGTYNAY